MHRTNHIRSLLLLTLVFVLTACTPPADSGQSPTSAAFTESVQTTAYPEPPAATLEINGKTQTAEIGSYCWQAGPGLPPIYCVQTMAIPAASEPLLSEKTPFAATYHLPLDIPPDSLEVVVIPVNAEVGLVFELARWNSLPLKRDGDIFLQEDIGLYVVLLNAGWNEAGEASYGFLVQVGNTSFTSESVFDSQASLPATIPPVATLEINGKTQTAAIGSYCWQNSGSLVNNVCVDMQGIPTANEPLVAEETPFTAMFHLPFDAPPDSLMISVMPAMAETIGGLNGLRFWARKDTGWSGSLPLKQDADILLQEKNGTYIIQLDARWNGMGEVSYGFLAQVGDKPVESKKIPVESASAPAFTVSENTIPLVRIGKGKDGDEDKPSSFEVSKDGRWVAISTMKGVYLYEMVTQEKIWFRSFSSEPRHLAFSPDGRQLSVGQAGNTLSILSTDNGETLMTLRGEERIRGVWSPDGKSILTSAGCEQVQIWDATTGELSGTVSPSKCNNVTPGIIYADWSGNGKIIYGNMGNGYVFAWDAVTLLPLDAYQPQPPQYAMGYIYPAPEESLFAISEGTKIDIIDGKTGEIIKSLLGTRQDIPIGSVAWSPDGKRIAAINYYELLVWDIESGEMLAAIKEDRNHAGLAWMPDNQTLIGAVSDDGSLLGFDFETGQTVFALGGWLLKPNSALGWDGSNLLTFDGSLETSWDSTTGEILSRRETPPPAWASTDLAVRSPDGRFVASPNAISDDSGNEIIQLHGDGPYDKVAWSPDGTRLVSGDSISGRVVVWDAQSGDVLHRLSLEEYQAFEPFLEALAWSPDGKWIVAGGSVNPSHIGFVILWDAQTGQQSEMLGAMLGFASIESLAWSPDGRWLAAGASGQTYLWDLQAVSVPVAILADRTGRPSASKSEVVQDIALSFSPDGHLLASTTPDGAILIWKIP